jgi:hypothetical protein
MVIYKVCTNTKLTCTHNISQLKKILNFQMCHLLRKCLEAKHIGRLRSLPQFHLGLKVGQGVFNYVLQSLYYNLVDMHKLTPNIQEVMAFPNWLSVK